MTPTATVQAKDRTFPFELPDSIHISIIDRRPSNYRIDGDGETGTGGTVVDTSTARSIKRTSNVMVFNKELKKWEVKQIRYLHGCPTIWVEEQERLNYKSVNPALNVIWLEHGTIQFAVEGHNIAKAQFLMLHENNGSFIGNDEYKRPDGARDVFFQIDTKRSAEKETIDFDFEAEAIIYLSRLKKGNGKEAVYNEDVLDFLTNLFKLPKQESLAETFIALRAKVAEDPKKFMEKIGNYEAVVQADVQRAIQTGVITLDEQAASFTADSKVFLSFPDVRMNSSEKFKAVLDFMLNPANAQVYQRLRALSVGALNKSAEIITE